MVYLASAFLIISYSLTKVCAEHPSYAHALQKLSQNHSPWATMIFLKEKCIIVTIS